MAGLTEKQRRFCDEYLIDLNATQAAIRAGYSPKTAAAIAAENLTKPKVAENIKKQGGFIPGIRPGKPTSDYLTKMLNYIIFIGAVGLIIVAVIPFFFNGVFGAHVSFGGTSIIIVVGVVLETLKQIESQLLVRNYKGFLNS